MALYRVAVCGDEADVRAQISADCLEVLSSLGTDAQLSGFSSADELRAELAGGADAFDLYLLDIQMEGTSGLELAQWLYDTGVRNRVIFITGSAEYALSGYSAHPLHYLLKPVGREELEGAMRLALEAREPQPVVFRQGGKTVSLAPGDILYAESRDHGTVIRMNSGERQCTLALTELEKQTLPWGAKLMTMECGMRFLADYLEGDHYFHIQRPQQNLDRARTQFTLVKGMEDSWDEMRAIVDKYRAG